MSLFAKYKQDKRIKGYTDKTGSTHASMRGGCPTVNPERRTEFFDNYFAAVKRGELLAWTERVPLKDPFRFLIDIDFAHAGENVSAGQLQTDLEEVVHNLCANESETENYPWNVCFASRCPYKLHFHFPHLLVNRKHALGIAKKVKQILEQKYPIRVPVKGKPGKTESAWTKIVDLSIYEGGMRLLGSRKSQQAEDKEQKLEEERLGKENVKEIPLLYKMTLPDGAQVGSERSHLDLCTILTDPGTELTPLPGLHGEEEDGEGSEEETAVEQRPEKIPKKTTKIGKDKPQSDEGDEGGEGDSRTEIPEDVRQELVDVIGIKANLLR